MEELRIFLCLANPYFDDPAIHTNPNDQANSKNDQQDLNTKKQPFGLTSAKGCLNEWCPDSELNQGHGDFQSPALPTELSGHIDYLIYKLVGHQGLEPGTCRL